MKYFLLFLLSCAFFFSPIEKASAEELIEIKSGWLNEYEIFPVLYAHDIGKDKEKGYIFNIQIYPTGKRIADSMQSDKLLIGVSGLVPALQSVLQDKSSILAIASDETRVNTLFTRQGSDILSVKGINPDFPDIYGSADLIRGKTVLCPLGSNSHQLLLAWLQIIGLQDSDLMIIDTKPEDALKAFQDGLGDVVVLWAPATFLAKELGFPIIANATDCDINFKTVMYASEKALEQNAKIIHDFREIYLQAVDEIEDMPTHELAKLYQAYQKKYANLEINIEEATQAFVEQKNYNKEMQVQEFENKESEFYKTLMRSIDFYAFINALSRTQIDYLKNTDYLMHE